MSIASATHGLFIRQQRTLQKDEDNLQQFVGSIDENKKEFNQLKEILREYNPDANVARANTIKRRKNTLKNKEFRKFLKIPKPKNGKQRKMRERKVSEGQIIVNNSHFPEKKDLSFSSKQGKNTQSNEENISKIENILENSNIQGLKEKKRVNSVVMQRNYSKDEQSEHYKQNQKIEVEEDVLYFQYNSDGQANQYNYFDEKLDTFYSFPKIPTLKKTRSDSQNGNSLKESMKQADQQFKHQNSDQSQKKLQIEKKHSSQKIKTYESLFNTNNFLTLNQIFAKNPNAQFVVDHTNTVVQNPYDGIKQDGDEKKNLKESFGTYLTVSKRDSLNPFNKMENITNTAKKSIRLVSTSHTNLRRIAPIPEDIEVDTPKINIIHEVQSKKTPSVSKKQSMIDEGNIESPLNKQELTSEKRRALKMFNHQNTFESGLQKSESMDPDQQSERPYTSFLTLKRYEKLNTQEFREEDVEIMNINSILKQLNFGLQRLALYQMILICISFAIFITDMEVLRRHSKEYEQQNSRIFYFCNILRSINSILCIILVTVTISFFKKKFKIARIRKFYPAKSSLCNRFEFYPFFFECLLFSVHLPPFFDITRSQKFFNQDLFYIGIIIIMSLKFKILIRVIAFYSPLNSSKGRFIVALRGIDYTNTFLVKVWLTLNPVKGIFCAVVIFITLNSYLLLLFESGNTTLNIPCYEQDRNDSITSYREALWLVIITFLTVGYGDFYPTTYPSRYIAIITSIGGQLYSAIIIGMVHSQLMLTSEESGVIKSNEQIILQIGFEYYFQQSKGKIQEISSCNFNILFAQTCWTKEQAIVSCQIQLFYLCRHKGNIHWYKTRAVANIKFELYVEVMRFKKIKHELNVYNSSRPQDQNLNIIRNTENQLALLATQVITIFDYLKDPKLERIKNISESYQKGKSIIHQFIEEEKSIHQACKKSLMNRVKTLAPNQVTKFSPPSAAAKQLGNFPNAQLYPSKTKAFQYAKTFVQNISHSPNIKGSTLDEDQEQEYLQIPNLSVNRNSFHDENDSISMKLNQRKEQEMINRRLSIIAQPQNLGENSGTNKSKFLWKSVTSAENLCESLGSNTQKKKAVKNEKVIITDFISAIDYQVKRKKIENKQSMTSLNSQQSSGSENSLISKRSGKIFKRNKSTTSPKKIYSLNSYKQHHSKSNSKKTVNFVKRNTLNSYNMKNSIMINTLGQTLKAQKTQLHPTMNSIVEEEETYSEENENRSNQEFEQIEEEESQLSNDEDMQENDDNSEQISQDESDRKSQMSRNKQSFPYMPYIRNQTSKSSISEAFQDYKLKEEVNKSFNQLKNICANQSINKKQEVILSKLKQQQSDEDLLNESPSMRNKASSSFCEGKIVDKVQLKKQMKQSLPEDISFFISDDQISKYGSDDVSSQKLSNNSIKYLRKQKRTKQQQQQSQFLRVQTLQNKNSQQYDDLLLSPIYPLKKKQTEAFQINLKSLQILGKRDSTNSDQKLYQQQEEDNLCIEMKIPDFQEQKDSYPSKNQFDLLDVLERCSSTYSLSKEQKLSLLNYQEQINQILNGNTLQGSLPQTNNQHISWEYISKKEVNSNLDSEKTNLKKEVKEEEIQIQSLQIKIQKHEELVNKVLSDARAKIQKLKSNQPPTLQFNVINNVNNIHNISHGENNGIQMPSHSVNIYSSHATSSQNNSNN